MRSKVCGGAAAVLLAVIALAPAAAGAGHRVGAGVHYWAALKDINLDGFDDRGYSYVFSFQYRAARLAAWEAALEVFPANFAGSRKDVYAPHFLLILGSTVYAGAGVGGYVGDGRLAEDPFWVLRAGYEMELLPNLLLDIHGQYRFENWKDLQNEDSRINSDTVTLGTALRIVF